MAMRGGGSAAGSMARRSLPRSAMSSIPSAACVTCRARSAAGTVSTATMTPGPKDSSGSISSRRAAPSTLPGNRHPPQKPSLPLKRKRGA